MENWRRFINEQPRAIAEASVEMLPWQRKKWLAGEAGAYTKSLPPELIEYFEKERRRMIQDYSSGRGARNIQNHLMSFFQRRQKDLEAGLRSAAPSKRTPRDNSYRKIYESFKNGTAYKQYFKDTIIKGLSAVKITFYDTMEQFASALGQDPKHASGTSAFYEYKKKAIGIAPWMSRGSESRGRKSRESIIHELEHAVSHLFKDASFKLQELARDFSTVPRENYSRILKDLGDITFTQTGKLGKILDPEKIKQGNRYEVWQGISSYRERPEEQRAFIKSWTSTFKEDIKPEAIKALCELLSWRRRISDPQYVPTRRQEEVMRKWISEFKKTAKMFPELDALLPDLKLGKENWMIMNYINCKDLAATADALNTLAKAQTRKTSIPAE